MSEQDTKLDATERREAFKAQVQHPRAETIFEAGLTTEQSLDWEAQLPPPVPAPEPTPDDPVGWANATEKAQKEHDQRVAEKRDAFRARAEDLKERWQNARNYGGEPKGYER